MMFLVFKFQASCSLFCCNCELFIYIYCWLPLFLWLLLLLCLWMSHIHIHISIGMTLTFAEYEWDEEQKNIAILKRKWPRAIRDHTKRPNEAWREPATGSTSFVLICCEDAKANCHLKMPVFLFDIFFVCFCGVIVTFSVFACVFFPVTCVFVQRHTQLY